MTDAAEVSFIKNPSAVESFIVPTVPRPTFAPLETVNTVPPLRVILPLPEVPTLESNEASAPESVKLMLLNCRFTEEFLPSDKG